MRLRLIASACVLAAVSLAAHASPIFYSLYGNFTGSLAGKAFTNQAGEIDYQGDTAGIQSLGNGYYTNTGGKGTFGLYFVAGYEATFLSPSFGVESEYGADSFYDIPMGFSAGVSIPGLSAYDLSSKQFVSGMFVSTGPLAEKTSLGNLIITGAQGDVSFRASSPTPEPSSLLLLGTGLLTVVGMVRRRMSAVAQPLSTDLS